MEEHHPVGSAWEGVKMLWAEVYVVNKKQERWKRVSELCSGKQEKSAAGWFSVIFRLFLKDNLSALRKKKQAKAYKNHMHFKYRQFLDVRIKP